MIRWLILLLITSVIAANVIKIQHKQNEHIDKIIKQNDCYLVGTKNPGTISSQPIYRCGDALVVRDKLIERFDG